MNAPVRRVGVVATLSILMLASTATFATSRRAAAGTEGGVDLVTQDAWTPIGGTLDLEVFVPTSLVTQNATLSLVAYQPVTTRSAFERVVDSGPSGSVRDQVVVPLALLPASPTGTRALSVGIETSGGPRAADRLSLRRPGVYPLLVEVRDGEDRVQGGFTTFVVAVETDSSGQPVPLPERLGVAWVWPLAAGPSTLPDGQVDPEVLDQLRPDGRLGRQAAALTRADDVPLTLVPGPETLDAWARASATDPSIARGEAALLDAASREQVVPTTYVPSDLPSLLAAGLGSVVDAQLVRGDDTLARLLGTRPDVRSALGRPVDAASLARLRARGVDRVIIDSTALADSDGPNPTRPFSLQPPPSLIASGPVTAIASDASVARFLDGPGGAALRAQLLFAALSVIALETPALVRAVTIVNPDNFDPASQLLDAILTGLRGHPWLVPMTADEIFESVPPETTSNGTPVTRELAPYAPPPPPVPALTYLATQQRLDAFRSLVGPSDPQVAQAEEALLISESSAFSGSQGALRARSTLESVRTGIDDFLSLIRVPQPSTITLTSRSGEIPLTFRNETGRPIDVTLQLNSQKLTFPEGTTRTLRLPTRSTTLRVPVEARTSGTFPLQLTVTSADGALTVANRTFRVRSTAFSTVGVILMAGAAVFLAGWWGVHIRRNHRHRPTSRAATSSDERLT